MGSEVGFSTIVFPSSVHMWQNSLDSRSSWLWNGQGITVNKSILLLFILKNFRASEILSHLQANRLVGHSFMDVGRKHETDRPAKKMAYYSQQELQPEHERFFGNISLNRYYHSVTEGRSGDTWTHQRLHYRKGILSLRNTDLSDKPA